MDQVHQNLLGRRLSHRGTVAVNLVEVEQILQSLSPLLARKPVEQLLEKILDEGLFSYLTRYSPKVHDADRCSSLVRSKPLVKVRRLADEPGLRSRVRDEDIEPSSKLTSVPGPYGLVQRQHSQPVEAGG